ncbi:MAG: methionine aminotransferase [Bacteroidetes bacterium]|jgi:methionine aminotransferase|nr:methionine aminotransferase [Bacteroidota bacterium]
MPEFTGNIRSKLPKAGTTIFAIMSGLANEVGAINLSQGFPGFPVSPKLIELYNSAMKAGHNQYAPMPGILPLRERIAEKMQELYSSAYNPDTEITITAGGTQALYTAISAFIHEGDEVIVLEPAYDSYVPAINMAGGIPVHVHLKPPAYKIPWEEIKKLINQRTRMIIINTPQNPTGTILTAADMLQLEKLTDGTDIIVLSDEVYEHIIFDGYEHQSVARFPKLASRSLLVYSFGKTFHATGWKTGYCIGPANLMKEFRKVHQFMVFSVNTPLQYALAEYMKDKSNYQGLQQFYAEKRDYFRQLINGSAFKILPCMGSYFQLLDYSGISKEKDTDYAIRLTRENGVASIPVSVFYHIPQDYHLLRFCFAKENTMLEQAAERLLKIRP